MAKEEELKRVDLKVNVSCCEGCRRKVMKAMSLKGVLRTEIDPSLDRVTVVGNVDTKVLIKKLAKVGKIAEVVVAPPPPVEEPKKVGDNRKTDHDKPASSGEEKSKRKDDGKDTGDKAAVTVSKKDCSKCTHQQAARGDHGKAPSKDAAAAAAASVEEGGVFASAMASPPEHAALHQQYYHRAEPPTMVVPMHMPPYHAAASVMPYYYGGYYGMPAPPPPMMPVARYPQQLRQSRFDVDYFDDNNAVGCRVM